MKNQRLKQYTCTNVHGKGKKNRVRKDLDRVRIREQPSSSDSFPPLLVATSRAISSTGDISVSRRASFNADRFVQRWDIPRPTTRGRGYLYLSLVVFRPLLMDRQTIETLLWHPPTTHGWEKKKKKGEKDIEQGGIQLRHRLVAPRRHLDVLNLIF